MSTGTTYFLGAGASAAAAVRPVVTATLLSEALSQARASGRDVPRTAIEEVRMLLSFFVSGGDLPPVDEVLSVVARAR